MSKKVTKSSAFIAREKRNVENAKTKREAQETANTEKRSKDLADINAAKIDAVLKENAAKKATPIVVPLSNQPDYSTDQCIHDILTSSAQTERAGVGLVVNLFADNEQWSLTALRTYFGAKTTQSVINPATGKKQKDSTIPTRSIIATAFLSRNAEYKASMDELNATKSAYKTAKRAKPVDHMYVSLLATKIENDTKPLNAAYQKVHRAFLAVYHLRVAGFVKVRLGPDNQLLATNANSDEKVYTESDIRAAGTKALTEENLIVPRGPRGQNGTALSAVDAQTAGPVIDALVELIGDEKKIIPTKSEDANAMTLEKVSEVALASLIRMTRANVEDSPELRSTLSDIQVELSRLLSTNKKAATKKAA